MLEKDSEALSIIYPPTVIATGVIIIVPIAGITHFLMAYAGIATAGVTRGVIIGPSSSKGSIYVSNT